MERMASVHLEEGNLENAFILHRILKKYNTEYLPSKNKSKGKILKKLEHQGLIEVERKQIAQILQQQLEVEQISAFQRSTQEMRISPGLQVEPGTCPRAPPATPPHPTRHHRPSRSMGLLCPAFPCTHGNNSLVAVFSDQPSKSDANHLRWPVSCKLGLQVSCCSEFSG
ncbi:hypothetical protein MC885_011663 [Smutsia gigantea]|nr:hypothetical protein MC885_011663 [Smutsia gigantea]